jgi:DNA-damage-inducible protein J
MKKNSVIAIRVNPVLKRNVGKILSEEGLTIPQAVTLFLERLVSQKNLPFQLSKPNAETRKAISDIDYRRDIQTFTDVETLINDLESCES